MALCNFRSLYILVLLFQLSSILIPLASPLSFNLTSQQLDKPTLNFSGDAYFNGSTVQLTKDQSNASLNGSVGSAMYSEAVPLWDKASDTLANFTTNFRFAINSFGKNVSADRLAFFLSPFPFENSSNLSGGTLGLDASIRENVQFLATVSYEAVTQNLSVFLSNASDPQRNWSLSYVVDLRKYLPDKVAMGFSAATGKFHETHSIYSWDFNSSDLSSQDFVPRHPALPNDHNEILEDRKKSKTGLVVGLAVGIGTLLLMVGSVWLVVWGKKTSGGTEEALELSIDPALQSGYGPKRFSYRALARATRNFAKEGKLGEGGFGEVYKGVLRDSQLEVAIKRISRGSRQGIKEYISEVTIISRVRHRNLVQLVGFCHEKGDLLLVYEYMPNKSLDYHLYSEERSLTWPERCKIALGLASALLYLHEEWEQSVVHRDVKPSNVMLDSEFNAKLGDFGLARLVDHDRSMQTTDIAGTRGYISPEYATTGKPSKESDVYSFGVVILEIACGRKPIDLMEELAKVDLIEWVWELYGKSLCLTAADEKLHMEFDEQQMERFIIVGLWCVHPDYNLRPSIRQAIHVLNFDAPLPNLPSKMPVPTFFTPPDVCNLVSTTT